MIFEKLIFDLLDKYVGKYVIGFNREQVNVGLFKGRVALENLQIKPDALETLGIPITVLRGSVGYLEVDIPFQSLRSQPVVVNVDRVFVILSRIEKFDEKQFRRGVRHAKEEAVQARRYQLTQIRKVEDETQASFTAKLINTVLDNIQIKCTNIHIRYEDPYTDTLNPFALGITMEKLVVRPTNDQWQHMFYHTETNLMCKLVEMSSFSIYWNSNQSSNTGQTWINMSPENFVTRCKELIPTAEDHKSQGHTFMLTPIQSVVKFKKIKAHNNKTDKIQIEVEWSKVDIQLSDAQYRDILTLMIFWDLYERWGKYKRYCPTHRALANPRAWWKFAATCVVRDIRAAQRQLPLFRLGERRKTRQRYIALYKRMHTQFDWVQALSAEEIDEVAIIEDDLDVETIVLYRSLADAELDVEAHNRAALQSQTNQQSRSYASNTSMPSSSGTRGHSNSIGSGQGNRPGLLLKFFNVKNQQDWEVDDTNPDLSDDERQELYASVVNDIFRVSDSLSLANKVTRKVKYRIQFDCPGGVFNLVEQTTAETLLTLQFTHLCGSFRANGTTVMADASIDFFDINGKVCRVCKQRASGTLHASPTVTINPTGVSSSPTSPGSTAPVQPMLAVQFVFNPEGTTTVTDKAQRSLLQALELRSGPGALSRAQAGQRQHSDKQLWSALRMFQEALKRTRRQVSLPLSRTTTPLQQQQHTPQRMGAISPSMSPSMSPPVSVSDDEDTVDGVATPSNTSRRMSAFDSVEMPKQTQTKATSATTTATTTRDYWEFSVTLVPVEVLVHVPFLTKIWDFFIEPWYGIEVEWESFFVALLVLSYNVLLHLHGLRLIFLNHLMGPNTPLLEAHVTDLMTNVTHNISGDGSSKESYSIVTVATIVANYFNNQLTCWEPLLESWQMAITVTIDLRANAPTITSVRLDGNPLRVSLSYALLKTLADSQNTFTAASSTPHISELNTKTKTAQKPGEGGDVAPSNSNSRTASPAFGPLHTHPLTPNTAASAMQTPPPTEVKRVQAFFVHNSCGLPIQVQAGHSSAESWKPVQPGEFIVLDMRCRVSRVGAVALDPLENLTVNLQIETPSDISATQLQNRNTAPAAAGGGHTTAVKSATKTKPAASRKVNCICHPLENVPIDRVGTYVYSLVPPTQNSRILLNKNLLVCEVTTQKDYSNLLTVRSGFRVHNALSLLSVELKVSSSGVNIGPIHPQQFLALPLHLAHETFVCIRPTTDHRWSEEIDLRSVVASKAICRCENLDSNQAMFVCRLRIDGDANHANNMLDYPFTLHIESPLVLKNLLPETLHFKITADAKNFSDLKNQLAKVTPSPSRNVEANIETHGRLKRGETLFWYALDPTQTTWRMSIRTASFPVWSAQEHIFAIAREGGTRVVRLVNHQEGQMTRVNMQVSEETSGTIVVTVFASHWIVNHTGMTLHVGNVALQPSVDSVVFTRSASSHNLMADVSVQNMDDAPESVRASKSPFLTRRQSSGMVNLQRSVSATWFSKKPEKIAIAETTVNLPFAVDTSDNDSVSSRSEDFRQLLSDMPDATCLVPGRMLVQKHNRVDIRTEDSHWTTFSLDKLQSTTYLRLKRLALRQHEQSTNKRGFNELLVTVEQGQERYKLTKIIRIFPKFMLDNQAVHFLVGVFPWLPNQKPSQFLTVPPGRRLAYHPPSGSGMLCVDFRNQSLATALSEPFALDAVGANISMALPNSNTNMRLWVEVVMEQGVIVVVFRQDNSLAMSERPASLGIPELLVTMELQGVFVSLVDHTPQELLNLSVNGLGVEVAYEANATNVRVVVENIQIDNQIRTAVFPVLLSFSLPSPNTPCFSLLFNRVRTTKFDLYREFDVNVQPINVAVDGELVDALYDFWEALSTQTEHIAAANHDAEAACTMSINFNVGEKPSASNMPMLFTRLNLPTLKLYFTNLSSQKLTPVGANPLNAAQQALYSSALNVATTCIRVKPAHFDKRFTSFHGFMNLIMDYYHSGIKRHLGKLIGHSLLIGNPLGVGNLLVSAAKTSFLLPFRDTESSCWVTAGRLVVGVFRFGQYFLLCPLEYLRLVTFSLGQFLAVSTMDQEFVSRRFRRLMLRRPRNVGQGLLFGTFCLRDGVVHGVKGLLYDPVRGLLNAEGGTTAQVGGFAQGFGKGLYGFGAKPVCGLLDCMSCIYDGARASVGPRIPTHAGTNLRIRPPRSFSFDRVLRGYSRRESDGQNALSSIEQGLFKFDLYLDHVNFGETVLMMTSKRVLVLYPSLRRHFTQVPLELIQQIETTPHSVVLHTRQTSSTHWRHSSSTTHKHKAHVRTQLATVRTVTISIEQPVLLALAVRKLHALLRLHEMLWAPNMPFPPPSIALSDGVGFVSATQDGRTKQDVKSCYSSTEGLL